jgi:hypothetical protein
MSSPGPQQSFEQIAFARVANYFDLLGNKKVERNYSFL